MHRTGIRPIVNGAELDVPIAAFSAGQLLYYDGSQIVTVAAGSGGTVAGPGASVNGNLASWNGVGGNVLADSGISPASIAAAIAARGDFFGPGGAAANNLVSFANGTGKLGADSGIDSTRVVIGNGSPPVGALAAFASASPYTLQAGIPTTTNVLVNQSGNIPIGNLIMSNIVQGVRVADSGLVATDVAAAVDKAPVTRELTADAVLATGAIADIATMSCPLTVGTYSIRLVPLYTIDATGTISFAFSFSGTTVRYRMGGRFQSTATGSVSANVQTTVNTAYTSTSITAAGGIYYMGQLEASITVSSPGTLQLRASSSVGSNDLRGGSTFTVFKV